MNIEVVRFCADEVARQGRGPTQVGDMVVAWAEAEDRWRSRPAGAPIDAPTIQRWGHLVEPTANPDGQWRSVGVRVGPRICPHPGEVAHLMARFIRDIEAMTPEGAYRAFEEIHPFRDGNGRVGKIIYNWLRGSLNDPQMPPNFWGIANP